MLDVVSLRNAMNSIVPITRFNRGEANKIFDEVRAVGCKIVLKNNEPACVLITPERFQEMVDMIDDQYLLALAEERIKNDNGVRHSAEDVYTELGIERDAHDEIPMEYGVDFE